MLDADAMIGCGNRWEFLLCFVDRQYVRYAVRSKKIIRKNKQAINFLHFYLGMNSERFISLPALYAIFFLFYYLCARLSARHAWMDEMRDCWRVRGAVHTIHTSVHFLTRKYHCYKIWFWEIAISHFGVVYLMHCSLLEFHFFSSTSSSFFLTIFQFKDILSYIYSKLFRNIKCINH